MQQSPGRGAGVYKSWPDLTDHDGRGKIVLHHSEAVVSTERLSGMPGEDRTLEQRVVGRFCENGMADFDKVRRVW